MLEQRHRLAERVYSVCLDARHVACGSEGKVPVRLYDWREGSLCLELPDEEDPPLGVTTCLLRPEATPLLAGNTPPATRTLIFDLCRMPPNDHRSLPSCRSGQHR